MATNIDLITQSLTGSKLFEACDPFQKQIIALTAQGLKKNEVANTLGVTKGVVSKEMKKAVVKKAIADANKAWWEVITSSRKAAAIRLTQLINSRSDSISLRSCEAILQLQQINLAAGTDEKAPY